jgi:CheY-like chemotaxis protein
MPLPSRKQILVLWNDDRFSQSFALIRHREHQGDPQKDGVVYVFEGTVPASDLKSLPYRVVSSESELGQVCTRGIPSEERFRGIIILAELAWESNRTSSFCGYEVGLRLIRSGLKLPIVFVSFVSRRRLVRCTKGIASLLARIFPHDVLPYNFLQGFEFETISDAKWFYIQRYLSGYYVDHFLHDIRRINASSTLEEHKTQYERLSLSSSLLDAKSNMLLSHWKRAIQSADLAKSHTVVESLQGHLNQLVSSSTPTAEGSEQSSYRLLILEDDDKTRTLLEEHFSPFFVVTAFNDGEEALEELRVHAHQYSAFLSDLELLDTDGSWQRVQGFDVLEFATRHPHLAAHGLTSLPRRSIAVLQHKLKSRATIWPKSGFDAGWFSQVLLGDIRQRFSHRRGPKLGAWKRGLLDMYYSVKEFDLWPAIWSRVTEAVDGFLHHGNPIGSEIFGEKKESFEEADLELVLTHRLVCLYYQYKNGSLSFREVKETIGFQRSLDKHYFNSFMGFSFRHASDPDTIYIQKHDLLEEEVTWLKENSDLRGDVTIRFAGLVACLSDIKDQLPKQLEAKCPGSINSLKDCQKLVKVLRENPLKEDLISDIWVDIDDFLNNSPDEVKALESDEAGREVLNNFKVIAKKAER